ncbi:riboflavin synthase [Candidatus Ruminimicrobium bovinum]|uniref:riboflavin synthase n=1 Tax=Candidatus Ruminimicrobium bovinum TaxID=3242779 RepID=UPI0039B899A3
MFTGIVEDIGKVINITNSQIQIETCLDDIKTGDSIAVNGVCLTVTEIFEKIISFDYSPTTSDITNISLLKKNSLVNLERALTLQTRLGGHIVSGHIDTSTKIIDIKKTDRFYFFSFAANEIIKKYIVLKGFIAIDGISLTVAENNERYFSVTMIPETFNKTIFHLRNFGDIVNVEIDVFAKYVEKLFGKQNEKKEITVNLLKENGFI